MPGTNTSTGSRTSPNPYIQKLQNLRETPERFLQKDDPSRLLRTAQEAARQDALSQQNIANQNRASEYNRQRNANIDSANLSEEAKQRDFNRRMQEKEQDIKNANRTVTITNKVDNSGQINFERQRQLEREQFNRDLAKADRDRYNQQLVNQQQQSHERTQQAAQLVAQQRLAQIQQDTAVLTGNPGESTWRWF